ncbi:MAG: nucleotidyltransferase domain-containing protein [Nanopusillaceae archaeon]
MDKRAIEIANKIKEKLEKEGIKVDKIILFGSRARGDYLKESDYDFIIVSKDFKNIPITKRIELALIDENVDVICLTPEEFEKEKNFLGSVVSYAVKEGVEIKL